MKRLSISVRLRLAFAVLIAVIAVETWMAVNRMHAMYADFEAAVATQMTNALTATEGAGYNGDNARLTAQAIADGSVSPAIEAEMKAQSMALTGCIDELDYGVQDQHSREMLQKIRQLRTPYLDARKATLSLLKAGKRDDARRKFNAEVLPALKEYRKSWLDLAAYQGEMARNSAKAAAEHYASGRNQVVGLSALAALIALLFSIVVAHTIVSRQPK